MTDIVNLLEEAPQPTFTAEEKSNLTVLKDTQTAYGGTFANRIKPLSYDAGFKSDVSDEFALSWMGQAIEQTPSLFEIGLSPIDFNYDPFDVDNLKGYEEFALDFSEVRNKEHHDYLKGQIDKNKSRRARLNASQRGMSAALLGNILDPINFVPIPLVKGVSVGYKALKGAAISGGLVAATEPVRRGLDLTATREETMGYIGAAAFFGGLFVGGVSMFSKGIQKHTIKPKGGINKMAEKYFKAHYKTEGKVDWEATGFIYKVKDDLYDVKVVPDRPTNVKLHNRTKLAHLEVKGPNKNKLVVDTGRIRRIFDADYHIYYDIKGVTPIPRDRFKTPDDFIQFVMKKEINKRIYWKRKKGELLPDYENRINSRTLMELEADAVANRRTATNKVLESLAAFSNYEKVMREFPDPYYAKEMQRLTGDYGTAQRAIAQGVEPVTSAMMQAHTRWASHWVRHRYELDNLFGKYRGITGNQKRILGMNLKVGGIRAVDAWDSLTRRFSNKNTADPELMTHSQFMDNVSDAVMDSKIFNDSSINPVVKEGAITVRKFYKSYADDATELGMFESQGNYKKLQDAKLANIEEVKSRLANKALSDIQIKYYNKQLHRMQSEYRNVKAQADDLGKDISPPYTQPEEFFQRVWLRDMMMNRKDELIGIFIKWFTAHPTIIKKGKITHLSTNPTAIKKRAEDAFHTILNLEANFLDGDGMAGWGLLKVKDAKGKVVQTHFKAGVRPLMSRKIDIPNKLVKDFISTDMPQLMRDYHMRMSNRIELEREFGDAHLSSFLDQTEMRLIDKELKQESDWKRITRVLNAFEDDKDKMLGTLNIQDPASFNKRSASLLKDWASLAFMGKVVMSALPDSARPIMVNGFKKVFGGPMRTFFRESEVYAKQLEDLTYLAPITETAANLTRQRFQMDGGSVGLGKGFLNRQFDKGALMMNKVQGPFYFANLLTPWTHGWKTIQGLTSAHRFIEDSVKVSGGTASKFDIDRLASYGISEKTAELIAKMPWEKNGSQYVANGQMWASKAGGETARRKYSQAIWADYQRTIITPTHADTFNMMHGVLRVDNEISRSMLRNPLGRMLGYTDTKYGGKVSNAWLGLPFQFFSWAIAANRKLLISGLQGRELAPISGALAMVTMGILGDYMKNPRYWSQKDWEEKLIRGVELSGVLALFGDMNFMLETISMGQLGARPSVGLGTRFGDPDMTDVIGEFTGAGPSIPIDLLYAFLGDSSFSERSATLRRIIPLNTLWLWDRKFKDLWQLGEDKLR